MDVEKQEDFADIPNQLMSTEAAAKKYGVHSCIHENYDHICGCQVQRDHPNWN